MKNGISGSSRELILTLLNTHLKYGEKLLVNTDEDDEQGQIDVWKANEEVKQAIEEIRTNKTMKFTWKHKYGPESEKHGGWSWDCYLMDSGEIMIATINMSGSFKEFKSSVNKFHVEIINCDDMEIANRHYFSDDLEEGCCVQDSDGLKLF